MNRMDPFQAQTHEKTSPKSKIYTIETSIGMENLEFTGVLLGEVSTKLTARTARWTDMSLYRITEGPNQGHYILEVVGCSDIYHRVDARRCKGASNGDLIRSDELSADAEPCTDCKPAGFSGVDPLPAEVVVEVDLPQVSECASPADVLSKIRDGAQGRVSIPAQRLLAQASATDKDINAALNQVKRI